jgi:Na+-driven multidrug efflux pump
LTFSARAVGEENLPAVGTYLIRYIILGTVLMIPFDILLFFIEDFLVAIGQDTKVSKLAG